MRRLFVLGSVAAIIGVAAFVLISALFGGGGRPGPAAALPATVQGTFGEIALHTRDGRDVVLPATDVTCTLQNALSETEGLYDCPAPYDLTPYLLPPVSAAVGPEGIMAGRSPDALVFVRSNFIISGFPANTWQTVQVNYGTTLTSPYQVVLGAELTKGETGHIENTSSPNTSRGVFGTSFRYRATTNSSVTSALNGSL